MISFIISGTPKALKRHRSSNGRMYDPSSKDKRDMWLQIAKHRPETPLKGCIYLKVDFYMPHIKSHYRTGKYAHLLKDNIPKLHSCKPDLDNLLKMIADIVQGRDRIIYDDSQICWISATKIYGDPRTEVMIEEL